MTDKQWKDISYLQLGNTKQKRSYELLENIKIFKILNDYDPILVGTIPLAIDIESSDLDIICKVNDFEEFRQMLINNFGIYQNFTI